MKDDQNIKLDCTVEQLQDGFIYFINSQRRRDNMKLPLNYNEFVEYCKENLKFYEFYVLKKYDEQYGKDKI